VAYLPLFGGFPVNPLPLFMGATQLWQQRLLPASAGTEPGQQQVMRWLPLIFVGMFYMISSGLVLYWTVSNLLSILQTYITKTAEEPAKPPPPVAKKKV
jgi:YidC/Oxa1 family membrane protein insertase